MHGINLSTDCVHVSSIKNTVDKYLVRAVYTRNTSMWTLDKPMASLSGVI